VPVSTIKKITAKRLTESKQTVPHFYLTVDVNMDAVNATRARMNALLEKEKDAKKISVNDFVVKASAAALRAVPEVNSSWMETHVRRYKLADVCVAVQTDKGLMVPVVRSACCLGLRGISSEVKSLAEKAKMGKLQGKDVSGGTFTVSNLGMFGIKHFAAIVNPPQAGILAVGGTRKEIVKTKEGMYKETNVMSATLSCDHRAVDGADGAKWLGAFKSYMEDPSTMLL
jgi:pyruvate dehydrogenase E2 component (dihydrolipoamide acetyltransferase)